MKKERSNKSLIRFTAIALLTVALSAAVLAFSACSTAKKFSDNVVEDYNSYKVTRQSENE